MARVGKLVLVFAAVFASGAPDTGSGEVDDGDEETLLNPSGSTYCAAPCGSYKAGASANTKVVCQYAASGVGDIDQIAGKKSYAASAEGMACFPPYNCGPDWTVCIQHKAALQAPVPAAAACDQISGLVNGSNSGKKPPSGGWVPTEVGGWMKMTGTLGCGWGSTYGNVAPGDGNSLANYGRVEVDSVSTDRDCCLEALTFEGESKDNGGQAIRFGVQNDRCYIDREKMMNGNLDVLRPVLETPSPDPQTLRPQASGLETPGPKTLDPESCGP